MTETFRCDGTRRCGISHLQAVQGLWVSVGLAGYGAFIIGGEGAGPTGFSARGTPERPPATGGVGRGGRGCASTPGPAPRAESRGLARLRPVARIERAGCCREGLCRGTPIRHRGAGGRGLLATREGRWTEFTTEDKEAS